MHKILILLLSLWVFVTAAVAEDKFLEPQEWPKTCEAAVIYIANGLDGNSKQIVIETPFEDLIKFHHGWGTGIRNHLGLWRGNTELMQSCLKLREKEEFHPDSVSMIIIEEVWKKLKKEK